MAAVSPGSLTMAAELPPLAAAHYPRAVRRLREGGGYGGGRVYGGCINVGKHGREFNVGEGKGKGYEFGWKSAEGEGSKFARKSGVGEGNEFGRESAEGEGNVGEGKFARKSGVREGNEFGRESAEGKGSKFVYRESGDSANRWGGDSEGVGKEARGGDHGHARRARSFGGERGGYCTASIQDFRKARLHGLHLHAHYRCCHSNWWSRREVGAAGAATPAVGPGRRGGDEGTFGPILSIWE
jgi:hypothetical protein